MPDFFGLMSDAKDAPIVPSETPQVPPASESAAVGVGRLERVDARTVWAHEERDFTPWLLENADYLADALGIDLEFESAEHRVGAFELDLLGRDVASNAVLVAENQLEATDHTHLGQLLTYAAGTGAGTIIWIATHFAEQHRQAIDWLNQRTDEETSFFRGRARTPSHRFIASGCPFQGGRCTQRVAKERASSGSSGESRRWQVRDVPAFWPKLIARLNADRPKWTRRRPDSTEFPHNWLDMPCPVSAARFSVSFARGGRLRHEIYIDGGDAETNLAAFHALLEQQTVVEEAYGRPLAFEELSERAACRIADYADDGDVSSVEKHQEYIDWFIDTGDRFRRALEAVDVP